ncbi:MAG TPA: hypothetical protein VGD21_12030 [Lysobacter sp.]
MKPSLSLIAAAAFALLGIVATASAQTPSPDEAAKSRKGYAISPVPLNLTGKNPFLVGLGSYIVNSQGACTDCHTSPPYADGGDPFLGQPTVHNVAGFLAGGTPFGPFISRNLTPNASGLPAGLTLDQFMFVLNTGADLKGQPPFVPSQENDLLQVMPWPVHRNMTRRDQRAIYEYLRAIPCVGSAERCGN